MADEKSELKISSDDEIKVKDSKDNEDIVDKQPETITDNSDQKATQPLSKRQQKKLLKRQKYLEERKERKVEEKAKRREKIAKRKAEEPDLPTYSESRKRINNSYKRKEKSPVNIVFDMGFGDKMNQKDRGKCLKQILHCYSINRRLDHPMILHITNFDGVMKEEMSRHNGYENWDIQFHAKSHTEVFVDEKDPKMTKNNIVYLSSDSENVIGDTFDPDKTYVIGALVDHNLHKGLCYDLAKEAGISHARLPIDKYISMKTRKVLSIDHVFQIIGSVVSQKMKWSDAFLNILPDRKGAELKEEQEGSNSDNEMNEEVPNKKSKIEPLDVKAKEELDDDTSNEQNMPPQEL